MKGPIFLCLVLLAAGAAGASEPVRVGLLQFGTVNWEMAVAVDQGLDREQGVEIQVVPLGSKNAVNVALQGGSVDLIVGDWIWVNRQRAQRRDYSFFPYSLSVGGLYARPDAGIRSLRDLAGRKLGVAGGPVDKSWLLLQAKARADGWDLAESVEPAFGAPPLLNHLMLDGDLPAVLNFWHYGARLQARGMQRVTGVADLLRDLGVAEPVPMLGWIFSEKWARERPDAVRGFLAASYAAKRRLGRDDVLWDQIRGRTKAEDDATLRLLRDGYRAGIPKALAGNGEAAAARVFSILAREGGAKLVGEADALLPGTFWQGADSAALIADEGD